MATEPKTNPKQPLDSLYQLVYDSNNTRIGYFENT